MEAKWQTEIKRRIKERRKQRKQEFKAKKEENIQLATTDDRFKDVDAGKLKKEHKKLLHKTKNILASKNKEASSVKIRKQKSKK